MADTDSAGGGPEADLAFGHYRVLRRPEGTIWELGRGAMGVTYKAHDDQLRIDVALKVITPAQVGDARAQALFLREARAAARVHHSNVASVVHLDTTPGNIFYAMEFIPGESLAQWLRTHGALPPAMALGFATQVARGLEAIHEQQIVHRDLKPGNLMIVAAGQEKVRAHSTSSPEAWLIKIIDFGLARTFGGEGLGTSLEAQTVGFRGTTLYASPEQCEERGELDGRSDQYSLGCILWEMLTGAPPFRGKNHRELLNQHVAMPLPLERIAPLPAPLQAVLTRMLAKDPAHRFANDGELVAQLEACRAQTPGGGEAWPAGAPVPAVMTIGTAPTLHETTDLAREQRAKPKRPRVGILLGLGLIMLAGLAAWLLARGRAVGDGRNGRSGRARIDGADRRDGVGAMSRKTIAVLPFENLSGRPEDAYLADGLQEEILNALARLRDLKVISRTSVMEYRGKARNVREIGERLGAGTILEGSVRREGNTLRLTVQLIDARNDQHLFATSYDRELNKVLDLQSAVARQVADALSATLTRQERGDLERVATSNGDAYDRYLRASALYHQTAPNEGLGWVEPKRLLEEALKLDPDFADAYALLSQANSRRFLRQRSTGGRLAAAKSRWSRPSRRTQSRRMPYWLADYTPCT